MLYHKNLLRTNDRYCRISLNNSKYGFNKLGLRDTIPLFDSFHFVIQILALPQLGFFCDHLISFQCFHCYWLSRTLAHVNTRGA